MARAFDITPKPVPPVQTPFRRIVTPIPAPASLPVLRTLLAHEPVSMTGQPPILWDRAEGCQVFDAWGNMWLDWSSGVVVTNAGHGAKPVRDAIVRQAEHGLLHSYCFPNAPRAALVAYLARLAPPPLSKVFLLTTGSEATECALKLARTRGQRVGGPEKLAVVSFERGFHGRTLGAQQIGGSPALKAWIGHLDPDIYQVPFPDGFRTPDVRFDLFLRSLAEHGVRPARVAGVILETFQGGGASFAPPAYIQALHAWCREQDALLIFDEIQAGFGRTGRLFGFEHYGVVPDLICCGKGISSSLPLSAVIGPPDVMDLYGPAEMTSTHTGNPVCAAAALASLQAVVEGGLVEHAARMGHVLLDGLRALQAQYRPVIGAVHGRGLVAGLHCVRPGGIEPDGELAFAVVEHAVRKGLLLFAPVGFGGATVKIAPPLPIGEEAIRDGLAALDEAFRAALHRS
ncbi:MAG: aspartate aminotransferase family protein [Candidatus Methylomirabilales bacterium]